MKICRISVLASAFVLLLTTLAIAQARGKDEDSRIKRVLLISVDGMHAVDFLNCAKGVSSVNNGNPYCPAIAGLAQHGRYRYLHLRVGHGCIRTRRQCLGELAAQRGLLSRRRPALA